MSSRPRVYCRIRPLNDKEKGVDGQKECFYANGSNALEYKKENSECVRSKFDSVLGPTTTQEEVYSLLNNEVISSLFTGYNATVFAYGQTGSGKTHTMEGSDSSPGLIPRLIGEIFRQFEAREDMTKTSIKVSYVQIYQDQIQDLLHNKKLLDIKLDRSGHYIAQGATWKEIESTKHAIQVYAEATKNRSTQATDMNQLSSRSHALLQFHLEWDETVAPGSNAKLNLIDLAGSEKVALSGASGETLKEAIAINKSLSALSNVVKALVNQARDSHKKVHIPYKDSKLTYLLQSSLGGNNLIHFILCLSASVLYRNEGCSTVEFGKRALKVVLKPVKNPIDYKRLEEMERMIELMRAHISELEGKLSQRSVDEPKQFSNSSKQEDSQFLQMDVIKNIDDPTPEDDSAASRHKKEIRNTISDLESQQQAIEDRLQQRQSELNQLDGRTAREKTNFQKNFEEDKKRMDDELRTLRSNVARQQQILNDAERKHHKRRSTTTSLSDERRLSKKTSAILQKTNQELSRIYKMLPESLHELTSHCILFPDSKSKFRELGGLKKLLCLIDCKANKGRESYIAHAAYALSIAVDEKGRDEARELDGIPIVSEVLKRSDEHSKQFACRALESLVRGCSSNKQCVSDDVLYQLGDMVGTHPHQQVQESACSALAEIADGQPQIKDKLLKRGLLNKMINLIRDTPPEVADLIKVGVTVIGRLAQQHTSCQAEIAKLDGIQILVKTLFSPVGERDPQLPVLTAYALVNVCCNNKNNMTVLQKHPNYSDINFKLLEGLGRVFSDSITSENRSSSTASHTIRDNNNNVLFSYFGVTYKSEWGTFTAGGRPTYSTFIDNPQFMLQVPKDCNISIVLSDTSCDNGAAAGHQGVVSQSFKRLKRKTIYMGIAVFKGDKNLLVDKCLKQLDFNGRFITSGRYNRNRENTLSLTLKGSPDPYIIIPFTAHAKQHTNYVLGVFADEQIEVTHVPEEGGWIRRIFEGFWSKMTGRGVDNFDWRNSDQYRITVSEPTLVTVILSYKRIDDFRVKQSLAADDEEIPEDDVTNEEAKERPHLHGRIFNAMFAPQKRYIRSNVPSPQNVSFVACNEYLSSCTVKTHATLQPGIPYVYVPFTENPIEDEYRLAFYSDQADIDITPLEPRSEWYAFQYSGAWDSSYDSTPAKSPMILITGSGKVTILGYSKDVYLLLSVYEIIDDNWKKTDKKISEHVKTKKVAACDAFWANECVLETTLQATKNSYWVTLQGITTKDGEQLPATNGEFHLAVYADDIGVKCTSPHKFAKPPLTDRLNADPNLVGYGVERVGDSMSLCSDSENSSLAGDDSDCEIGTDTNKNNNLKEELESTKKALLEADNSRDLERKSFQAQLEQKQEQIDQIKKKSSTPVNGPQPPRRGSSIRKPVNITKQASVRGNGSNAVKTLRSSSSCSVATVSESDLNAVSAASDNVVRRITTFSHLERIPSLAEFKKIQEELMIAANKLASITKRTTAP